MKKLIALMTVLAFALTFSFAAIAADKPAAPATDKPAAVAPADKPAAEPKAEGEMKAAPKEEGPGQEEG